MCCSLREQARQISRDTRQAGVRARGSTPERRRQQPHPWMAAWLMLLRSSKKKGVHGTISSQTPTTGSTALQNGSMSRSDCGTHAGAGNQVCERNGAAGTWPRACAAARDRSTRCSVHQAPGAGSGSGSGSSRTATNVRHSCERQSGGNAKRVPACSAPHTQNMTPGKTCPCAKVAQRGVLCPVCSMQAHLQGAVPHWCASVRRVRVRRGTAFHASHRVLVLHRARPRRKPLAAAAPARYSAGHATQRNTGAKLNVRLRRAVTRSGRG